MFNHGHMRVMGLSGYAVGRLSDFADVVLSCFFFFFYFLISREALSS